MRYDGLIRSGGSIRSVLERWPREPDPHPEPSALAAPNRTISESGLLENRTNRLMERTEGVKQALPTLHQRPESYLLVIRRKLRYDPPVSVVRAALSMNSG